MLIWFWPKTLRQKQIFFFILNFQLVCLVIFIKENMYFGSKIDVKKQNTDLDKKTSYNWDVL